VRTCFFEVKRAEGLHSPSQEREKALGDPRRAGLASSEVDPFLRVPGGVLVGFSLWEAGSGDGVEYYVPGIPLICEP